MKGTEKEQRLNEEEKGKEKKKKTRRNGEKMQ